MLVFSTFLLLCILTFNVYYDFRYRAVPLYLLFIAVLPAFLLGILQVGGMMALKFAAINLIIISVQLFVVYAYFSIKNKKWTGIIDKYIGTGDLLFYVTLVFCFSPVLFILFNLMSYCLILFIYLFQKRETVIPLAGYLSVFLGLIIILSKVNPHVNLFDDVSIISRFL